MALVKTVRLNIITDPGDSKTKLDLISRKADDLGKMNPTIKPQIDDLAAKLKLDVLKNELRSIGNGPDVSGGGTSGWQQFKQQISNVLGSTGGGAAGSGLLGMQATLPLLGTLGVPALGALTIAAAGLVLALTPVLAALIPVTLGFGVLAIMAKNTLSPVFTALGEHGKALAKTWKTMSESQKDLYRQALPLKTEFGQLAKAVQPEIYKAFATGLRIIKDLMPALKPLVMEAGRALDTFLKKMSDWLSSPQGQSFIHWLKTTGPQDIKNFGRVMWDIAHGVGDALHWIYSAGSWIDRLVTRWGDDWLIIKGSAKIALDGVALAFLGTVKTVVGFAADIPGPWQGAFRHMRDAIGAEMTGITADVKHQASLISGAWAAIHGKSVPLNFDLHLPTGIGITGPGGVKTPHRAAGWRVPGYGGGDRWPALLEGGEAVVPKHLTPAVAPFLKAHGVPGFAAGGIAGPDFREAIHPAAGVFASRMTSAAASIEASIASYVNAHAHLTGTLTGLGGGFPAGGPGGGAPSANAALARAMMPAWGSGPAWAAWNAVAMRESGWNQFADNASSGAYGIPQSLPFTKMPKAAWPSWAGGSSNPAAQIGWMIGYIRSAYGSPQNAWAHELSAGWYDKGGYLPPGASIAYNGTGRPERVGGPSVVNYNVHVAVPASANQAEVGRHVVTAIREFEKRSGSGWRRT